MVDKLGNYLLDNVLYKDEKITGDQREIMLFGVVRILEDIPKYVLIILISFLFNILKDVAIVGLITICYKGFIGGAHARTNLICFLVSLMFFTLPVIISKNISLSNDAIYFIYFITFIYSTFIILKISPADTEEIPILSSEKRKRYKLFAFISLLLIYIVTLYIIKSNYISTIIISTIFLINTFSTKPFYRLFKCKYSYESEEFKDYFNNKGIN